MDTTDPQIAFDGNGYCNHCTDFLHNRAAHQYQGDESTALLDRLVEDIKRAGRGRKYDCIVGISGGVDSCYTALIAKRQGLRVLAVHMDNGWNSEEAVSNIRSVTEKLEIDYESYVLDWEVFRDLQLAFLKASIPEADTPTDIAIPAALHHFASKYGVKHIISGGNFATEGILPATWHYNAKDMKYFKHIQKTFGRMRMKNFPTFGFMKETYYKLVRGIKIIYLLNYVNYVTTDVMKSLEEELNWRDLGGKHYESTYTHFIQSYYLYEKFGIDYRKATLSSKICSGDVIRDDAIEQLQTKPYEISRIEREKKYISKKLRVAEDEFEKILALPSKWYWDYPNDNKKLCFIYDTYRRLYGKEKLGSF